MSRILFRLAMLVAAGAALHDAAGALAASPQSSPDTTVALCRFRTDADVKNWQVPKSKPPIVIELSKWPDGQEGACAKVTFPKWEKGSTWMSAVNLKDDNLAIKDWRAFDAMSFEIWSEYDGEMPLRVHLYDSNGGRSHSFSPKIVKGRQTVTLDAQWLNAVDASCINQVQLFITHPLATFTFHLGEIKLHRADLSAKVAALQAREKSLSAEAGAVDSSVLPVSRRDALIGDLKECRGLLDVAARRLQQGADVAKIEQFIALNLTLERAATTLDKARRNLALASGLAQFKNAPFGWGSTTSLEKVFQTDYQFGGAWGQGPNLTLARNEHEAAQVVVLPLRDLKNVRIETGDLAGPNGAVLKQECLRVDPVGYVDCKHPPYKVQRVGWHPDPILTYISAVDVPKMVYQAFWVEAFATQDQPAGTYKGTLRLLADGVEPVSVPLTVTVRDFVLQDGSRLPLAMSYQGDRSLPWLYLEGDEEQKTAGYEEYREALRDWTPLDQVQRDDVRQALTVRRQTTDMLMDHRLTSDLIYRGTAPTVDEAKYILSKGANRFTIVYINCAPNLARGSKFPPGRKKEILDQLALRVPQYLQAGILDRGYIYAFDEVHENTFAAVMDIFQEIRKRYPQIPILTTARDPSFGLETGLDEVVDAWAPLLHVYDDQEQERVAARARGRQVWWYVCVSPRRPYPNWFIEFSATEHRLLPGFMSYKFKTDGFLYYALASWANYTKDSKGKWTSGRPSVLMTGGPLTNFTGNSWQNFNGDGRLVYPGNSGPVPTIRLKNIRDGLEDYIYLKMLEDAVLEVRAGKRSAPEGWLERAEAALVVNKQMVDTLTRFSTDGNILLAQREQLSVLIEQIGRKQ